MSASSPPRRRCPVAHVQSVTPCPEGELAPLLAWLDASAPLPETPRAFTRGTVLPDGRLDLCKQRVGPLHLQRLLRALAAQPRVRHVLLGTDGLGDQGAQELAAFIEGPESALETLYLGCNAIGPPGVQRLAAALRQAPAVRALWLKRNPVGLEGAEALADLLRDDPAVAVLDLVNTELGDEGVALIAHALHDNTRLHHLYLGGNGITSSGAASIAAALRHNKHLVGLYLAVNDLGDEGAAVLGPAVAAHPALRRLALTSCDLGPEGARALCGALGARAGLEVLELHRAIATEALGGRPNRLGDEGAGHVAAWLALDPPLRALDLRHNDLTGRGARVIERGLAANTHLAALRLGSHTPRKVKRRIQERLRVEDAPDLPEHVRVIQSVYRTPPAP